MNNDITSNFPPDSLIPTDLNSLLFLEFQSMAFLADLLGDASAGAEWRRKADAVNQWLWDESFGTYAAYDLHCAQCRVRFGGTLDGDAGMLSDDVGKFAYLSSLYLYPLYADHFASWNILADIMPDYISGGETPLRLFPWEERNAGVTPS